MDLQTAHKIFNEFKSIDPNFFLAGSARRKKEKDLHDIDLIYLGSEIPTNKIKKLNFDFTVVGEKIVRGTYKSCPVDIYKAEQEYFGAMLLFLTGSSKYGIKMRAKAKYKGLKLSQYGLFNRETNELIAGKTEEDIYEAMGLKYKEPELRM